MTEDFLISSDAVRTGGPLKHAKALTFDEPLKLTSGLVLPKVCVAYETYGRLNADKSNAVLICHALSGDSHVARHDDQDDPGWWDIAVGPGKAIDTDRYFVICSNILGGCRGTTGPGSTNPETGKPYGRDFPTVTIADMVDVQARLVDHLGIDKLLAVIGGSMGGHQVLSWATRYPARVCGAAPIATSPRLTSQALAFDVVARNSIMRDPCFHAGQYYDKPSGPTVGLALARMIGHITYLSAEAMQEKFDLDRFRPRDVATQFEKKFSVGSYLGYQGTKFVERFDANSYITITMAMDLFDLGRSPEALADTLGASSCRWLVVSFTSDWLFPPSQSQDMVRALVSRGKEVNYCNVWSDCGHDAFLLEDNLASYGKLIGGFLANMADQSSTGAVDDAQGDTDDGVLAPTSIYQSRRLDYEAIINLIPPAASVLDLGCGHGALLRRLKQRGHTPLVGVELDEQAVVSCVERGLEVLQADINHSLPFGDRQFDFVVLSQTLQAVHDVETVMADMLRIGRRGIVSFPNFGYYKLRRMLADEGRAPEAQGLLRHKWYNSPNIRFLTLADFEDFCHEKDIIIHRRVALDTEAGREVELDPNLYADLAIFVLSKA